MSGQYYRMDYDDWDDGTHDLTLEEEAAYLRLCHQMYRRRGPIHNSESRLASLWRCHQNKARALLKRLIEHGKIVVLDDGRLANDRVARELDHQDTIRRQRADAGHTGGTRSRDARRNPLKSLDPSEANAFARRIDENIETVVVVEGARGREAGDGPGRLDITAGDEIVAAVTDELVPDGHRLRGDVLAASVALGWLRSGYDLQRDILPGVRLAMLGQHRISQWRSLTGWIANVHADRAAAEKARPPPPESSHPDPVVSPSRSRHDQPSIVEIGQAIARHDYAAVR